MRSSRKFRNRRHSSASRLQPSIRPVIEGLEDRRLLTIAFEVAAVTLNEGDAAYTVNVTRTDTTQEVAVNYSVAGTSTATQDADFTLGGTGTLTFAVGEATQSFTVTVTDDNDAEPAETIVLDLGGINPPEADTLGAIPTTTITIATSDGFVPAVLTMPTPVSVSESVAGGNLTLTVTRAGNTTIPVSAQYAIVAGTAAAGTDYTAVSGPVNFAAGETTATITIPVLPDTDSEVDETFTVQLSAPAGGAQLGSPASTVVTILDDDAIVQFSAAAASVNETAGTIALTVTRAGGLSGTTSLTYATAPGTALEGTDFTAVNNSLTFAAGETTKQITVPIVNDTDVDPDETFTVALSAPVGGSIGATGTVTVTIDDDEIPGTFALADSTFSFSETAGAVTINVLRTGGSSGTVTVPFVVDNVTTAGADYSVEPAGVLTFGPGVTSQTITLTLVDDADDEQDETLTITLQAPSAGSLGATTLATVTIADNEGPGTFNFAQPTYSFAEGVGTTVTVTVVRTSGTTGEVTVPFTAANVSTAAGDYAVATASPLTFADGVTSQTISFTLNNDLLEEVDETFTFTLQDPSAGVLGPVSTTTVTIQDDDGPGEFSFVQTTATVTEGGQVVLTIQRTLGATGEVSVSYTVGGTTDAGERTITPAAPITFAEGETSKTITVGTVQDLLIEEDETIIVTLSDPAGGAALAETGTVATVTVNDNDAPGVLRFEQAAYNITEGGTATIMVVRSDGVSGTVTVAYTLTGTATGGGTDYTLAAGTVTFAEGVTSQTITIPTVQDLLPESSETVILTLGATTAGALVGTPGVATLTIVDDDTVNVAPTAQSISVTRAPGQTLTIDVRSGLSDANNDPLIISVTTPARFGTVVVSDNGTPADPSDDVFVYTPVPGTRNDRFTYRVADPRGATVDAEVTILVRGAGLVASVVDPGAKDLIVIGTVNDDEIYVARAAASGNTNVTVNGVFYGPFQPTGRIIVLASRGDDSVRGRGLANSLWVYGNGGNDTILGANQGDVLLGQAGNDVLKGLGGNDVLAGGPGRDWLIGNAGIDVLIGGRFSLDAYTTAAQSTLSDALADLASAASLDEAMDATGSVFSSQRITDDRTRDILDGRAGGDWLIGQGEFFNGVDGSDVLSEDIG